MKNTFKMVGVVLFAISFAGFISVGCSGNKPKTNKAKPKDAKVNSTCKADLKKVSDKPKYFTSKNSVSFAIVVSNNSSSEISAKIWSKYINLLKTKGAVYTQKSNQLKYAWYQINKEFVDDEDIQSFKLYKWGNIEYILVSNQADEKIGPITKWAKHVQLIYDQCGSPTLSFQLCMKDANKLKKLSKENISKELAFIIGNKICFVPKIACEIPDGKVVMSGNFSTSQLRKIISIINPLDRDKTEANK